MNLDPPRTGDWHGRGTLLMFWSVAERRAFMIDVGTWVEADASAVYDEVWVPVDRWRARFSPPEFTDAMRAAAVQLGGAARRLSGVQSLPHVSEPG